MMRPSPVVVTLPETSACALSGRQLAKFGVTLGGTTGSMKAAGIDRREEAGALQVGGDHLRDVLAELVDAAGRADERRDRDRHRLDGALRDVDAELRHRLAGEADDGQRPAARSNATRTSRKAGFANFIESTAPHATRRASRAGRRRNRSGSTAHSFLAAVCRRRARIGRRRGWRSRPRPAPADRSPARRP